MNKLIDVSVVVIGRNEARRLSRCLESVQKSVWNDLRWELIYVDSHSTDESPQIAQQCGARVLRLGDVPPSAAAARNLGWRAARGELILFLDGDTQLAQRFIVQAIPSLTSPEIVAVWGHRRELDPAQSIYTQVLDLDWIFAPGSSDYFGGDVLVRRAALAEVGGFDDQLVAGEEPELCRRLRAQGGKILHVDLPMTKHDLGIRSARSWWTRAERAGLAYAQVAARYARTADPLWLRESRRNIVHGVGLLFLPWLGLAVLTTSATLGAVMGVVLLLIWARSARRCAWKCPQNRRLAWAYAAHSHCQQIPILIGQLRWWRLQRQRKIPQLFEYRTPE